MRNKISNVIVSRELLKYWIMAADHRGCCKPHTIYILYSKYICHDRICTTSFLPFSGKDEESLWEKETLHACDDFRRANPFTPTGVFDEDDEVERRRVGRPSNIELDKRQRGKALRDQLRDLLWRRGLSRPAGIGGMISQRDRHNREVEVDNLV